MSDLPENKAVSAMPGEKGRLLSSITSSVKTCAEAAAGFGAELLSCLGAVEFIGVPGAATLFVTRIGFQLHTQHHIDKLKKVVGDMTKQIETLRKNGSLIDPHDEGNLWTLFDRIEAFLRARNSAKSDLLRRVALHGLIRRDANEIRERDFAYVMEIIEAEDIQTLEEVQKVLEASHTRSHRRRDSDADVPDESLMLPKGPDI